MALLTDHFTVADLNRPHPKDPTVRITDHLSQPNPNPSNNPIPLSPSTHPPPPVSPPLPDPDLSVAAQTQSPTQSPECGAAPLLCPSASPASPSTMASCVAISGCHHRAGPDPAPHGGRRRWRGRARSPDESSSLHARTPRSHRPNAQAQHALPPWTPPQGRTWGRS